MFDKLLIQNWVQNGIDSNAVTKASEWGKILATPNDKRGNPDGLTTSQIRNVFGELRRIQLNGYKNEKTSFLLLKPKLAYAVKRHKKEGVKLFYQLFCMASDSVDKENLTIGEKHFEHLMNIMEAVLAYHKFHSDKEITKLKHKNI